MKWQPGTWDSPPIVKWQQWLGDHVLNEVELKHRIELKIEYIVAVEDLALIRRIFTADYR